MNIEWFSLIVKEVIDKIEHEEFVMSPYLPTAILVWDEKKIEQLFASLLKKTSSS